MVKRFGETPKKTSDCSEQSSQASASLSVSGLVFFFEKLVNVGLRRVYKTRQVSRDQLFLPCPRTNLKKKTVPRF